MFPDPNGIVHEPYKVVLQFAFEWIRSPEWNAPGYATQALHCGIFWPAAAGCSLDHKPMTCSREK